MKEPGNYAEAVAVKQDGWAAEDSDEEGSFINMKFCNAFMKLFITTAVFISHEKTAEAFTLGDLITLYD